MLLPNPSLHLTFASRLRRLSPAGELKRYGSSHQPLAISLEPMEKRRIQSWAAGSITTVFAATLVFLASHLVGYDLFSFSLMVIFPVGAIALAFLATSGFILWAKASSLQAKFADQVFLLLLCLALPVLIYGAEYTYFLSYGVSTGQEAPTFWNFVKTSVTESRVAVYARGLPMEPAQRAGGSGWALLVPRFASLLAVARIAYLQFSGGRQYGQHQRLQSSSFHTEP